MKALNFTLALALWVCATLLLVISFLPLLGFFLYAGWKMVRKTVPNTFPQGDRK